MKKTLRTLAANLLVLAGLIAFVNGLGAALSAFYFLHETKSMAEDDAAIVTADLIPHLKSPKNHYSLLDLADMKRVGSQTMADMLSGIESLFIGAGLCFCVTLMCWLLMRWFFPDRKELFKPGPIPGLPEAWQRPLKLWRSREVK